MSEFYSDLATYVRSAAQQGYARASLNCEWLDGMIKGPEVRYFDAAGQSIPDAEAREDARVRAALGGTEFERLQPAPFARAAPSPPPPPPDDDQPLSIPGTVIDTRWFRVTFTAP